jgi:hypothetical protein
LINFSAGQVQAGSKTNRYITRDKLHIFGLTNTGKTELNATLFFHRIGINEAPKVEITKLK